MSVAHVLSGLAEFQLQQVFFGPQGFELVTNEAEIQQAQLTYEDAGKRVNCPWPAQWLVFARDTELGDPYFVDINSPELAVFTTFYSEQGWQAQQAANSLIGFCRCLQLLHKVGNQQQVNFVPDENSIKEEANLIGLQQELNLLAGEGRFWSDFIAGYRDWLSDEDFEG